MTLSFQAISILGVGEQSHPTDARRGKGKPPKSRRITALRDTALRPEPR